MNLHESRRIVIHGQDQLGRLLQFHLQDVALRPRDVPRKPPRRSDERFIDDGRILNLELHLGRRTRRLLFRRDDGPPASRQQRRAPLDGRAILGSKEANDEGTHGSSRLVDSVGTRASRPPLSHTSRETAGETPAFPGH